MLSLGIISFLTYEGVGLSEELILLLNQQDVDTRSCVRRLHLVSTLFGCEICTPYTDGFSSMLKVVTAIKEFLMTLDCFKRIVLLSVVIEMHLYIQ